MKKTLAVAPLILALSVSTQALAANSAPMAVPIQQTVPDAQDVAYPGTMTLDIDATDVVRGDYKVTQTIPVAAGAKELILLYPQWLPGNHGPRGPLA
ncbi:MAG: peptidase M61, partial [Novosphingobium sp.]